MSIRNYNCCVTAIFLTDDELMNFVSFFFFFKYNVGPSVNRTEILSAGAESVDVVMNRGSSTAAWRYSLDGELNANFSPTSISPF